MQQSALSCDSTAHAAAACRRDTFLACAQSIPRGIPRPSTTGSFTSINTRSSGTTAVRTTSVANRSIHRVPLKNLLAILARPDGQPLQYFTALWSVVGPIVLGIAMSKGCLIGCAAIVALGLVFVVMIAAIGFFAFGATAPAVAAADSFLDQLAQETPMRPTSWPAAPFEKNTTKPRSTNSSRGFN